MKRFLYKTNFLFALLLIPLFLFASVSGASPKNFKSKSKKTSSSKTKKASPKSSQKALSKSNQSDFLLQHLANGNFSDAYASLQNIDKRLEEGTLDNPLYFLMGIIAFKEERYTKALKHFKKAYRYSSGLGDYVRFFIGKTHNRLNQSYKALDWLELPEKLERQIDMDIFWERIDALIGSSQWEETNRLLSEREKEKKKERTKDERELTKILYFKSKLAQAKGQKTTVLKLWKKLLIEKAGNPFEDEIKKQLKRAGYNPNTFLSDTNLMARASQLIENGLPKEALKIYQSLSRKNHPLETEIAYATYRARDYKKSAQLYQDLWDNPKKGQNRLLTLLRLTTSYGRSDQFEKALKNNKRLIRLFPNTKSARNARYKVAFIYLDSGQYQKAIQSFTDYLSTNPRYKKKAALWNRLWAYYLTKNYARTLTELESLEKKEKSKDELIRIAYWKARCLEKLGNKSSARQLYRKILQKKRTHYYTFVAAQRLITGKLRKGILVDSNTIQHIPDHGLVPESDTWKTHIPKNDPLYRAIELAHLGLSGYAYNEAEFSSLIRGGLAVSDITLALKAAHNYRRIAALGRSYLKVRPAAHERYHYWTLAYPRAYPQWVETFTDRYQLDPLLAWSVMREESAFKPAVVSSAQAIGLMQMIPQTGKEVAGELRMENFHPDDLASPFTNIQFGTWYLRSRLKEFGGNIVYAIASYNAGPEAVTRWKKWGDKLTIDEFIELIPYKETNNYVKKVLKSYWIYQRLYGGARIEPLGEM